MTLLNDLKQQYGTYNRNVKLFIVTNILTQIGMGIFMIMYNFYIRELGYSETVNGNIIAMTALASAIILVPAGIMSDRVGRKKVMGIGLAISSLALLFRSVLEVEDLLMIAAFITGMSIAFIQVSSIPWLAENSKPSGRVQLFSVHFAVMTGANVIGNILGGVTTDTLQIAFEISPLVSIRITLLLGVLFYIAGIIPIFSMKEIRPERKKDNSRITIKEMWVKNRSQYKIIALFAFAQILIGFGAGLVIPYLNLYFSDRFDASNSVVGIILSLGQAATAVATIIGPLVVKKVGEVRAVVYLQLLSLPFLLLTAYTENLYIAAIGFLFRQALMNAGNPIQASLVMSRVDDSMKGLANSINQMVFMLGWAMMGPVSTSIVMVSGAYWGYAYVFSITAVLYLIGAIYFFLVFRGTTEVRVQIARTP